jgi:hypothetical protein
VKVVISPEDAGSVEAAKRVSSLRRKIIVSVGGTLLVAGLLTHVLVGRGAQFSAALQTAPITLVTLSVLLQVVGVLARTEAWAICVSAAGGTVTRRVQFRAAAFGCVASIVNGSVGMAVRIGSLRRAAPEQTPAVPALVAAEVPIINVELALVAIFSFTLIAPLGVPLWAPAIIIAVVAGLTAGLRHVSGRCRTGLGAGLAVLRLQSRGRLIFFAVLAVSTQVLRNWLMLRAVGVDVSIFDAMALLIVIFTVGQLPIGPSTGPAATVLILGAHGLAATAAAGVLVTLTGFLGSLVFAAWAGAVHIVSHRRPTMTPPIAGSVLSPPIVTRKA